jgi:signal transduction histidine kinase
MYYTYLAAGCGVLLLLTAAFGSHRRSSALFLRYISAFCLGWAGYIGFRSWLGHQFYVHNEFKSALAIIAISIVFYLVFTGTRELFTYKSAMQLLERENELLLENHRSIEAYMTQIAQMKHEMKNHLAAMKTLIDIGQHERIASYISEIYDSYPESAEPILCGHKMIEAVLGHAAQRARQMDFEIEFDVFRLPLMSITDADAVSLLTNLLNNALESCGKIENPDERWIKVDVQNRAPYLFISVKNVLSGKVRMNNGRYVSSKGNPLLHGHGINIVRKIVKKYDGIHLFENKDDAFIAEVALRVILETEE